MPRCAVDTEVAVSFSIEEVGLLLALVTAARVAGDHIVGAPCWRPVAEVIQQKITEACMGISTK